MKITATLALSKFVELAKTQDKKSLLDIGCGKHQPHCAKFREQKTFKEISTCDFFNNNDYKGLFTEIDFEGKQFDAVWCAHVLEHQENVGAFLRKIHSVTKEGGLVAITVPPMKHNIVGGHLTLWNIGLLYYNIILAGFDCSNAFHKQYNYDQSIILNKKTIKNMPALNYDCGDIE